MIKKLTVALLALVALGGTVGAFSYWDTLAKTEAETLTVGEGTELVVAAVAEAPAGKVLVPSGVVLKANDLESITLTYNVNLNQTSVADLNLAVVASNIEINGSTANAGLVNIAITTAAPTVNNSTVLVTVVVTLTEPTTEAEYLAIINQAITFDLTFTASQN